MVRAGQNFDAVLFLDGEHKIVWWNDAAADLFNLASQDARGMPLKELLASHISSRKKQNLDKLLALNHGELTLRFGKSDRTYSFIISEVRSAKGKALTYILQLSAAGKVPQHLLESEEMYRNLYESAPIGIYRSTPDGTVLTSNPALQKMLGYDSEQEILERNIAMEGYESAEEREQFKRMMEKDGQVRNLDAVWKRRDGTSIYVRENAVAVYDEKGNIAYYDGTVEDVTEQKRMLEILKENEELDRAVIENSPLGISIRDRNGKLLYANAAWCIIWALSKHAVEEDMAREREELRFTQSDSYLGDSLPLVEEIYKRGGELFIPELKLGQRRAGAAEWVSQYFYGIKDSKGEVTRVVVITQNITSRKKVEDLLKRNNLYQEALLHINQMTESTILDILNYFLKKTIILTSSQFGYLSIYDEKSQALLMHFITKPDQKGKVISPRPSIYPLAEESPWGNALSMNKVITLTDLKKSPFKHEKDFSRVKIKRLINVPIYDKDTPVAVVGVGNKDSDYTKLDEQQLKSLFEGMWRVIQRRHFEQALRESENLNRTIVDYSPLGITVRDAKGRLLRYNKKWQDIWGLSSKVIQDDIDSPELPSLEERFSFLGKWLPKIKKIYTDGGYLHIPEIKSQRIHPKKDVWLSLHFYALTNEKGRVERVVNLTEDITERKLTEAAIKENEEKYRTLWESSPDGLFILTDVFIDCNEQATRIWACQREDIIGHSPLDFSPKVQPDGRLSAEAAKERISVALRGVPTTFYWQHLRKDGILIDCEVSLKRITIGGKSVVQAIVRDITERKRAEEALREQERFLASIFASIQDGISVLDNALNVIRVNPTMEKWYSHNMPLVGKKCYQVYHGLDKPCAICPSCRTIMEGESFYEVVPKVGRDGKQTGWLDLYSFPLIDMATGQLKGVIEYVRDITEQVSAQNALRESEERYRTIMEQSLVGATIIQNGRFVFANQAASTITGYSNNDILLWSTNDLLNFVHPDDRELVITHLQKTEPARDSSSRFIFRFMHKSGRYIWIEIFTRSIHYQHGDAELGLFIDVTDRKQGEIARQKLLKELSQRNKEMEEFVYSISHDLKTPLATILGYIEMIATMEEVTLGENQRKYIGRIEVAARRMVRLIDDLLLLSRAGKVYTPSEQVNVGNLVDEVFNQLTLKARQRKVELKRSSNLPELFSDRMRLSQVFTNLVDNAIKYSKTDGKPLVEVLYQEEPKEHLFTVLDNGIGIEPDYWNRIFEVFYRLAPDSHEGTGIGLALVRKIVESFGGRVWVESVLGEGSSFKFTLPK